MKSDLGATVSEVTEIVLPKSDFAALLTHARAAPTTCRGQIVEHEQTALKRQIAATDRQIDQLVYELYGLSEEEIKIVEESK